MFDITLICMGKLKEKFYLSAAEEYAKRLKGYCSFQLLELPEYRLPEDPSPAEIATGLDKEAELIFSASVADVERKVEEYRQSLLIHKIEQYYIDNEPATIVTDNDIATYYNAHKSEFRLDRTIVKGRVVSFGEKYRQRDKLYDMMRSPKSERQKDFKDICIKNGFELKEFTEWTEWSEFLSVLPTVRSRNYDSLLAKKGDVQKMSANGQIFYFQITEVLRKGDVRPLELASADIARVLKTLRRSEAIKSREEMILKQALENGHARIYKSTEN